MEFYVYDLFFLRFVLQLPPKNYFSLNVLKKSRFASTKCKSTYRKFYTAVFNNLGADEKINEPTIAVKIIAGII